MTASSSSSTTTKPVATASCTSTQVAFQSLLRELLEEVGVLQGQAVSVSDTETENNDATTTTITTNQNGQNGTKGMEISNLFCQMDQWLGIVASPLTSINGSDDDSMDMTVEDCAPFSSKVYEILANLVIQAWNPVDGNLTVNTNPFIQELERLRNEKKLLTEEELTSVMSLDFLPAVRVTNWIRQWMECNVEGSRASVAEDKIRSFSQYLLCGSQPASETPPQYAEPLIQAIFIHLSNLSTFQSQLLLFQQAFQRGDFAIGSAENARAKKHKHTLPSTLKTTALSDPTQRLHHYQISQQLAQKLTKEFNNHVQSLEIILGDWYASCQNKNLRLVARAGLGRVWMKFLNINNASVAGGYAPSVRGENTSAAGLDVSLRVLYRILLGMSLNSSKTNSKSQVLQELLFYQLLPLHQPSAMVLWRDQTSLLELYHEPLVQCMAFILKLHTEWIGHVCQTLLAPSESIWPLGGNTPKQVLLLHEVDTFLGMLLTTNTSNANKTRPRHDTLAPPVDVVLVLEESTFVSILSTAAQCMASEHSRLAERALVLFKNAYFKRMVYVDHYEASLRVLLPALTRSSSNIAKTGNESSSWGNATLPSTKHAVPWNPTVRKMTFHVLKNLKEHNLSIFAEVCNQLFGDHVALIPVENDASSPEQEQPRSSLLASKVSQSVSKAPDFNRRFSLQAGMGDWKPPPKQQGSRPVAGSHMNMPPPSNRPPSRPTSQPPLGVTGVAPWAAKADKTPPSIGRGKAPWANESTSHQLPPTNSKNPPSSITGVAPWAVTPSGLPPTTFKGTFMTKQRPGGPPRMPPASQRESAASSGAPAVPSSQPSTPSPSSEDTKRAVNNNDTSAGIDHVLYYMNQCKPAGMEENEDEHASSSWSKAQMEETPTLLPDLKFHDLVFGHELGHGAFGVVKYARLIDRTKTRSRWPEYAVKVIATEKLTELGYEYGVAREIACLRIVSHPNVARLVSSFRFQQGAYLVLEYASGGDLHQLLQQHGSLDSPSCQFVMGEVVAALASLHDDLGFVYGDLKPENIVLSETGHIKLTDFGACRPYTERARALVQSQMGKSGKNLLGTLREGDPRKFNQETGKMLQTGFNAIGKEDEEEEEEECQGWMSTEETSTAGNQTKAINDDTFEVMDVDEHKEDSRIEGTVAYLPPEVVLGSIPTPAADSWALGCVLYQCMSGRPPILEADDSMTRNRIVSFKHTSSNEMNQLQGDNDVLFGKDQKHAANIPDDAKALIRALLDREANKRPNMQQVAEHDFFDGQDVMRLYQKAAYPLDVGGVAPAPPDAQWSRRQFSSIWAPQPQAYDISGASSGGTLSGSFSGVVSSAPIPEGDEAGSSFSASHFYRILVTPAPTSSNAPGHASKANDNVNNLTQKPLAHIEEDDTSMASSDGA